MALYKNGSFIEDTWRFLAAEDDVPSDGAIVLGKARFLAEREALAGRNAPLGIIIEPGEGLAGIEADIHRFALVVLPFPKYTDGRAYSLARMLREEHGYRGELRASGNVLRDQVRFMWRCGIDALEVTHAGTIAALQAGAVSPVTHHYQPAGLEAVEHRLAGARPWLRRAAAHP